MNNNQNPNQVPDERLTQMANRLRDLENQNNQLRGQVDFLARGTQQPQQQKQSKFSPDVEAAITERVQEIVAPIQEQLRNTQGYMHDQVDHVTFMQKYNKPQYEKYLEQVENVRREAQAQGRWIPREQALQYVYFNETGKKPAPENTQQVTPAQDVPVYDTFLGQYVNSKGQVVDPPNVVDADKALQQAAQQQPVQQPQQMGMPVQQAAQQFQQQPVQQQQWPAQQQQMQPQQFQQQPVQQQQPGFQLPNQNPPDQARVASPAPGQHFGIDLTSSDQALDQWGNKYGDIPL
jgi:hypothetical protein